MRTEIEWAEVHSPIFLKTRHGTGINLGQKLDPSKRKGLILTYDEDKRHLFVTFEGKTARVPEASVLSMIETEVSKVTVLTMPSNKPIESGKPIEAQVDTPMSHVFAGAGKGKTGLEEAFEKAKK